MKKILVIGGTGFIGNYLVKFLSLKKNFNIDIIGNSNKNLFLDINQDNIRFLKRINITNKNSITSINSEYDYIIFCAGYVDHSSILNKGNNTIHEHYLGLINILKSISTSKLKRILYFGTLDEYSRTNDSKETNKLLISSYYSLSKNNSLEFLKLFSNIEKIPFTYFRLSLTYGYGQKINRLIPKIFFYSSKNQELKIKNPYLCRDFLHINDLVSIVYKTMINKGTKNNVYDLGSNERIFICNLVNKIRSFFDLKPIIFKNDKHQFHISKPNNLFKQINYYPKVNLDKGLKDYFEKTFN